MEKAPKINISIRISLEDNAVLDAIAFKEDRTKSYIASKAIESYIQTYKSNAAEKPNSHLKG